eukprot:gene21150-28039_t
MAPDPAIARKVGEGVDRPGGDNELPIDINYQKLSEWLKLPGDWHKRVAAIQVKMIESVKELPTEVLSKTKGGVEAPLDYFRAKEISSAMSAKAERTMFGGLTGAAATWDKIVKAYEKGNVWLGEAAQSMLQNADYEIPFLQKQVSRPPAGSQCPDLREEKNAEYLKSASQCAATFKLECKKMGIEGKSLRMELAALTSIELPEQLSSVVESLKGELSSVAESLKGQMLGDAFKYYKAFSEFVHGEGAVVGALLPILNEVHSGTTERPKLDTSTTEPPSTSADISIDWDVIDMDAEEEQGGGGGAEIDWAGASEGGKGGAAPTIEWDLDMVVVDEEGGGAGGAADAAGGAPEVSWDIDVAGGAEAGGEGEGGAADAAGGDGGIQWDIDMTGAGTGLGESGETGGGCAPAIDIDWDLDPEELKAEELKQKLGLAESGVGVAPEGASAMGARDLDLPAAVAVSGMGMMPEGASAMGARDLAPGGGGAA